MSTKTQSFERHAAWQPLFHFVASPITMLWALQRSWVAISAPSTATIGEAVVAISIAAGIFASRVMSLTVQNRVIRLEMRLRLREVLPPALAARIRELTVRQLIALRFASDAELPQLVERTLKGEFASQKEIKRAIKDWQPDFLRC